MIKDNFALIDEFTDACDAKEYLYASACDYIAAGGRSIVFSYRPSFLNAPESIAVRTKYYADTVKDLLPQKIGFVMTVTLPIDYLIGISTPEEFAFDTGGGRYIFADVPFGSRCDCIIGFIHNILYKKKIHPVIVSYEHVMSYSDRSVLESLERVPDVSFEFNLSSLSSSAVRKKLHELYESGHKIILGSGDKYASDLYKNHSYYTKLLTKAIGSDEIGYFLLKHNQFA